jgi:hypothetical protein
MKNIILVEVGVVRDIHLDVIGVEVGAGIGTDILLDVIEVGVERDILLDVIGVEVGIGTDILLDVIGVGVMREINKVKLKN